MSKNTEIKAGFGRVSMVPDYSVPLLGYGNSVGRMSQGYLNPVEVSCTAIQDSTGETVILISMDMALVNTYVRLNALPMAAEATGVPLENLILTATHTHSGADITTEHEASPRYEKDMRTWITEAAKLAMADLAPATLQTGAIDVEHMNFVRHYIMNDGTYCGDNFGDRSSGFAKHEREADKKLQLIKLVRGEGKKDILLVNWQSHPKLASTIATPNGRLTRNLLSADYVGYMRNYVEEKADCLVAFFLGAAGNLNPLSDIKEEQATVPENVMVYGHKVGDYVLSALENMKDVATGPVQLKKYDFPGQIDHSEDHMADKARQVMDTWKECGSYKVASELSKSLGMLNPYHAESILSRASNPDTIKIMEINAFSIGDVAFATTPYEMFCQNGLAVKEGSPFETTFMISCCNGVNGYIAADSAFEYNSYEVGNRIFVRGTAEAVPAKLVEMLQEMKK